MESIKLEDIIKKPSRFALLSYIVGEDLAYNVVMPESINKDSGTQSLERVYSKCNQKIFIQTCSVIIRDYGGYDNTPSWFKSAIQNIGIY
ncbi:MAG: hypothetical protein M1284_03570 [Candidatus Parvarchaeota archaeon]|jgi:hypothetical protein|nr:hypothetical protein [Candidatus Parvarchaeota archaeon]MCL5420798.1 hypothetical protein [Candidatus Parvarchaeota archaeon]